MKFAVWASFSFGKKKDFKTFFFVSLEEIIKNCALKQQKSKKSNVGSQVPFPF